MSPILKSLRDSLFVEKIDYPWFKCTIIIITMQALTRRLCVINPVFSRSYTLQQLFDTVDKLDESTRQNTNQIYRLNQICRELSRRVDELELKTERKTVIFENPLGSGFEIQDAEIKGFQGKASR